MNTRVISESEKIYLYVPEMNRFDGRAERKVDDIIQAKTVF